MSNEQKTREERIDTELKGDLALIREAMQEWYHNCRSCYAEWNSGEEYEDCPECGKDDIWTQRGDENYWESVVEGPIFRYTVYKVLINMSPRREFQIYVDAYGEISRIDYLFSTGWTNARRTLRGDDYDTAKEFFANSYPFCELPYLAKKGE